MKSWEKTRFGPLASHIPNNEGAAGFGCICDHKQRRGTEAEESFLMLHGRSQGGSQGQGQLPVRRSHKPRKRNLTAEGFVFPLSLLFTANAHQETMEMFWLYRWEALVLSIFIYSLGEKETHKKTHPHCGLFWRMLQHQKPDTFSEPCCIFHSLAMCLSRIYWTFFLMRHTCPLLYY